MFNEEQANLNDGNNYVNPFTDLAFAPPIEPPPGSNIQSLPNLKDMRVGNTGSTNLKMNDEGISLGGTTWANSPFRVNMLGEAWATTLHALGGEIGGFVIGSDYLNDTANSFGLASTVTGGDDVRMWFGDTFTNRTVAPGRIYESGKAVFENVEVAGTIKTSVFEKDVVSAVGGQLLVTNAGVINVDMTALDASTLTIKDDTSFAVNDILHLKNGTDEEYLRVTNIGSAPTYTVTRDLAGAYTTNNNPAWPAGTAVVVEGKSDGASTYSGGFLKLLGAGTNSPKYSVVKRTGVAYNALTEYAVLGNLNGVLDYIAEEYGIAVGTEELGYMAFDPTNGLRVSASKLLFNQRFTFGHDLTQGDVVAIESDNKAWKIRATNIGSSVDLETLADASGDNGGNSVLVGHRTSGGGLVATLLSATDQAGGSVVCYRSTIDELAKTIGTITNTSFTGDDPWCCEMTDSAALVVYTTGSTDVKARYLSDLATTVTANAEASVTSSANSPRVARYSDTEAVCVYHDTADDDIKVRELSVSGTTVTAGSATTLLTGTYQQVHSVKRFGTSNYYMAIVQEDTSNDQVVVCFSFDGATFTVGSGVDAVTGLNTKTVIEYLTDTKMCVVYKTGTDVKSLIVTRSGTTLTAGTPVTHFSTASASGFYPNVTRLGKDSYAILYAESNSGTSAPSKIGIISSPGTTPDEVGTPVSVGGNDPNASGSSAFKAIVKINPRYIAVAYDDSADDHLIQMFNILSNIDQKIGICADSGATDDVGGVVLQGFSDDPSGLTTATEYFTDLDGGLITRLQGGLDRFGVSLSTSSIKVE